MRKRKRSKVRTWLKLTALALGVIAVIQELSKPAEERAWNGTVAGFVPYDLRRPTMERARSRWWNPEDQRVFMPKVFGVGWTLNVGRLARLVGVV